MKLPVAWALAFAAVAVPQCGLAAADKAPTVQGHAHNDYEHPRPLLDALDNGFRSVEADVFLVDGQLLVGHTRSSLRPERTLQSLYLDPLRERVKKNGGTVDGISEPFTLFIDIKTSGRKIYPVLRSILDRYSEMLSSFPASGAKGGAIDVVVSGDRPTAMIEGDRDRRVGIDGRLTDLDSEKPATLMPVISDNWRLHFAWRGKGPMPADERAKLRSIVRKTHEHGRKLRFWATPEQPALWQVLAEEKVDLINTDDLVGLSHFLRRAAATNR